MGRLIKTTLILLWYKIKNFFRKIFILKPKFRVKKNGKEYVNLTEIYNHSNRHNRRAIKAWAKKNQNRIVNL